MRLQLRLMLPLASAALALALVLVIVLGSPDHRRAATPNAGFDGAAFPPGVHAHDFTLSDPHGQRRKVSLNAYRGQVVALAFLSSDCRTCVLVAQQVRGALDELGAHAVKTIFVSTDPSADTPASVDRFLRQTSLSGRVVYLTGTSTQLRPVWQAYGIITPSSADRKTSEAAVTVLLIDRKGVERVGFGVEQITPEGLSHDIRELQAG